jgi:tripartite-type tricarboxylate transporter receptor subunit TctC
MVAPIGVPEAIVNRLNAAMNLAIKSPEVINRLLNMGFEVEGGSVAEFVKFMREEQAELRPIIVEAGIKGD